jgi:hypothetical protein
MTKLYLLIILLFNVAPLAAADLGVPKLLAPPDAPQLFDPKCFLTTAGMKYAASPLFSLEPEMGVGYRAQERDISGGGEEATHRIHAQAGGRLSLAEKVYLSAAAKLPVYTFDKVGSFTGQDVASRQGYDITRTFRATPNWTGEVGVHLSPGTDLTLYYDQSPLSGLSSGGPQQEDRIGTRIIWRFK